jgi:hypothetical protein
MTFAPQVSHNSEREQQLLEIRERYPRFKDMGLTETVSTIVFEEYDKLLGVKKK